MSIEDQLCDPDLAQELMENDFSVENTYFWLYVSKYNQYIPITSKYMKVRLHDGSYLTTQIDNLIKAWSISDLIDALSGEYTIMTGKDYVIKFRDKIITSDISLANALAKVHLVLLNDKNVKKKK